MEKQYHASGDFGKVIEQLFIPLESDLQSIFCLSSVGWHECNDKYKISRPKGHDEHLLILTVKGEGCLKLKDSEIKLIPNTVAIIPAQVPNSYYTPENGLWAFFWLHPSGSFSSNIFQRLYKSIYKKTNSCLLNVAQSELLVGYFNELIKLKSTPIENINLAASKILSSIIHGLLVQAESDHHGRKNHYCTYAISYLESNFDKPIDIGKLSSGIYISKAHFIRAFKKETGVTPYEYLLKVRISKAAQLIKYTNKSVKEISFIVGFNQPSNFIAQFKRISGQTPIEYRKSH